MKKLSSSTLHIIAMFFMLCDHLWAVLLPKQEWLTCIGRIAFPIFAFLCVEGFYHTKNRKKYLLRLLCFAIITEVPFNLMISGLVIYPFHQNVIWTFILGILLMALIEKTKNKFSEKKIVVILLTILITLLGFILGYITMVDYFGVGILMILTFYFFHNKTIMNNILLIVIMAYLNIEMLGGYFYNITIGNMNIEIVQQGFALLALIPIFMYSGNKGYNKKWFQYFCYVFYPIHMLILYLIYLFVI